MKRIRVLIVDDSAFVRSFLTDVLSSSPGIEVVGTAMDAIFAAEKIKKLDPDVITLDVEMPRMDGITFLSKLMISHPMPVVMVSVHTGRETEVTIKALQLGAVDFILKPRYEQINSREGLIEFSESLINKIKIASVSNVRRADVLEKKVEVCDIVKTVSGVVSRHVIAIGASTGGVETMTKIVSGLRTDIPGIVYAQHMPKEFTKAFALSMDRISGLNVKEAEQGDRIYHGAMLVAPGNRHVILRKDSEGFFVELSDAAPCNRHKPSVDILFRSVAETAGLNSTGIILTGMGDDGARGLFEMKDSGAVTIAQDEKTAVVFGMPRKAIELGAVSSVRSLDMIVNYLSGMGKE